MKNEFNAENEMRNAEAPRPKNINELADIIENLCTWEETFCLGEAI